MGLHRLVLASGAEQPTNQASAVARSAEQPTQRLRAAQSSQHNGCAQRRAANTTIKQRDPTMMKVAVFKHGRDLSDTYLHQLSALGADAIDFGGDTEMPGVAEQ